MSTMAEIFRNSLHDSLDKVEQTSTIKAFYSHFELIKSLVVASHPWLPEVYFAYRFIYGLRKDIQPYVIQCRPCSVFDAYHLALIYEYSLKKGMQQANVKVHDELFPMSSNGKTLTVSNSTLLFVATDLASTIEEGGTVEQQHEVDEESVGKSECLAVKHKMVVVPEREEEKQSHANMFDSSAWFGNDDLALSQQLHDAGFLPAHEVELLVVKEPKVNPPDVGNTLINSNVSAQGACSSFIHDVDQSRVMSPSSWSSASYHESLTNGTKLRWAGLQQGSIVFPYLKGVWPGSLGVGANAYADTMSAMGDSQNIYAQQVLPMGPLVVYMQSSVELALPMLNYKEPKLHPRDDTLVLGTSSTFTHTLWKIAWNAMMGFTTRNIYIVLSMPRRIYNTIAYIVSYVPSGDVLSTKKRFGTTTTMGMDSHSSTLWAVAEIQFCASVAHASSEDVQLRQSPAVIVTHHIKGISPQTALPQYLSINESIPMGFPRTIVPLQMTRDVKGNAEQGSQSPSLADTYNHALALSLIKELKVHPPDGYSTSKIYVLLHHNLGLQQLNQCEYLPDFQTIEAFSGLYTSLGFTTTECAQKVVVLCEFLFANGFAGVLVYDLEVLKEMSALRYVGLLEHIAARSKCVGQFRLWGEHRQYECPWQIDQVREHSSYVAIQMYNHLHPAYLVCDYKSDMRAYPNCPWAVPRVADHQLQVHAQPPSLIHTRSDNTSAINGHVSTQPIGPTSTQSPYLLSYSSALIQVVRICHGYCGYLILLLRSNQSVVTVHSPVYPSTMMIGLSYETASIAARNFRISNGNLQVASVYASSDSVQLNGSEIWVELTYLLRLLHLGISCSEKPFPIILELPSYTEEGVLLQEPKAGLPRPAFTILDDRSSRNFLMLIRGTYSSKDTLTAATGVVGPFHHSFLHAHCGIISIIQFICIIQEGLCRMKIFLSFRRIYGAWYRYHPVSSFSFHHSVSSFSFIIEGGVSNLVLGYAHCGMVAAARGIAKCGNPCLLYQVKIVGHSLGGGTAALLAHILRERKEFSGVTFPPAPCMTWDLANGLLSGLLCVQSGLLSGQFVVYCLRGQLFHSIFREILANGLSKLSSSYNSAEFIWLLAWSLFPKTLSWQRIRCYGHGSTGHVIFYGGGEQWDTKIALKVHYQVLVNANSQCGCVILFHGMGTMVDVLWHIVWTWIVTRTSLFVAPTLWAIAWAF